LLSFCKFLKGFFFKAGDCKAGIMTQSYYFATILNLEGVQNLLESSRKGGITLLSQGVQGFGVLPEGR